MMRLLQIEWLKLSKYRPFWILTGLYFISLFLLFAGGWLILIWLESEGADFKGVKATQLPIYDFYDIWHNFSFLASIIKVIPAFVFLIMVSNEYSFKTLRQNIIDGMTRTEFLWSKILLAIAYSLVSTLFIFLLGLSMGLIFSPVKDVGSILMHIDFLWAHTLELMVFLSFTLFIGILVRRTGFALVLLFMYSLIIEPVFALWVNYKWDGPELFLPIKSINSLVPNPFTKYLLLETPDYVEMQSIFVALVWGILCNALSYALLRKRDLI
jgi:ABC-2 type transport system permease protein